MPALRQRKSLTSHDWSKVEKRYLSLHSHLKRPEGYFLQLLCGNRIRSTRHGVGSGARLREGDDVANGLLASQEHNQTIKADSNAAMRGRTKLKSVDKMAELHFHILFIYAATSKNALLQLGVVDTDGAAASFRGSVSILSQSASGIIVKG